MRQHVFVCVLRQIGSAAVCIQYVFTGIETSNWLCDLVLLDGYYQHWIIVYSSVLDRWLTAGHMQQVIVLFSSWPYGKQSVCVVTSLPHHPCVYLWCRWLVYDVLSHGSSCPLDWLTCIILVKIINAVLFLIRTKICALRRAVVSMLVVQLHLS